MSNVSKPTNGLRNWDLVLVEWQDAFDAPAGWHDMDSYRERELVIKSVGYYWGTANLDGYVVLAATRGIGQVSQVTHIPVSMIKTITKVGPMKKPAKVAKVMREYKKGTLRSGSAKGPKVKSRRQAIAIAMSEAGMTKPKRKTRKRK